MHIRKSRFVLALLILIVTLSGCVRQPDKSLQTEVDALLAAREAGVNDADGQAYLGTVLPGDAVLMKEETNLIRAAGSLGIADYTVGASGVKSNETGCTATLRQAYTVGQEKRSCEYEASFVRDNGKLYYAGAAFLLRQNGHVLVRYLPGREDLAGQILDAETEILGKMKDQLSYVPEGFISVKLFEDQSVFLQSIKLDLPQWVGGWHEYGESVKTFVGAYGTDVETYKPMLAHESTHRMVSELSNDNAAYWLQEGLAGVYQDLLFDPGMEALSSDEAAQAFTPYAGQKTVDLEKLGIEDQDAVMRYYATAKAYAAFLVDRYGWAEVRRALEYMEKYELIPVTGAEKILQTNARTDEAIRAVFGLGDDAAFQSGFEKWLENKK